MAQGNQSLPVVELTSTIPTLDTLPHPSFGFIRLDFQELAQ